LLERRRVDVDLGRRLLDLGYVPRAVGKRILEEAPGGLAAFGRCRLGDGIERLIGIGLERGAGALARCRGPRGAALPLPP